MNCDAICFVRTNLFLEAGLLRSVSLLEHWVFLAMRRRLLRALAARPLRLRARSIGRRRVVWRICGRGTRQAAIASAPALP